MGIKHLFVNPKSDGGDATITRPSDWNAEHDVVGPYISVYATGSFTVATGKFGLQGKRMELVSTDRVTIEGTGRLIISG